MNFLNRKKTRAQMIYEREYKREHLNQVKLKARKDAIARGGRTNFERVADFIKTRAAQPKGKSKGYTPNWDALTGGEKPRGKKRNENFFF